jgi:hypothetical protein
MAVFEWKHLMERLEEIKRENLTDRNDPKDPAEGMNEDFLGAEKAKGRPNRR